MVPNFYIVVFSFIFVWLFVLTVFLWKATSHYDKLVKGVNDRTLKSALENLIKDVSLSKKEIELLKEFYGKIQKDGQFHIQKMGLVRFNPFKDTGGDQSFVLSLLDGHDTGIIISGLYSRSGTRWYAKRVVEGKGVDHKLSEEEKKALKEAGISK